MPRVRGSAGGLRGHLIAGARRRRRAENLLGGRARLRHRDQPLETLVFASGRLETGAPVLHRAVALARAQARETAHQARADEAGLGGERLVEQLRSRFRPGPW